MGPFPMALEMLGLDTHTQWQSCLVLIGPHNTPLLHLCIFSQRIQRYWSQEAGIKPEGSWPPTLLLTQSSQSVLLKAVKKYQRQPETESSSFLGHNKHTLEKPQLGGRQPPQSLSRYFFLPAFSIEHSCPLPSASPSQKWASELHH